MTDLPKSQFVLIFLLNRKPFSLTVDNSGESPVVYDVFHDKWVEISNEELFRYAPKASQIITSED